MNQLPNVLENKTKIRFQDCDPFNHLNNGKYTNYFMNHREDVLIKYYNIDIFKIAKEEGKGWVSSSNQIAYLRPALLMETVIIQSQLIDFNDTEIKAEMRMYNEDKSQLKSVIWCSFVHFNLRTQKREVHSQQFIDLFKSVNKPVDELIYEERINSIKNNKIVKNNK